MQEGALYSMTDSAESVAAGSRNIKYQNRGGVKRGGSGDRLASWINKVTVSQIDDHDGRGVRIRGCTLEAPHQTLRVRRDDVGEQKWMRLCDSHKFCSRYVGEFKDSVNSFAFSKR